MKPVYTADEMRACDRAAIEQYRIPGIVLMENAARGAVDVSETVLGACAGQTIGILCGKGNNGGDGFAMARHYLNRGARVHILTMAEDDAYSGDALTNLQILRTLVEETDRLNVSMYKTADDFGSLVAAQPTLLVDALLGTGLSSPVRDDHARLIEQTNAWSGPLLAVDIPSGIHSDSGDVMGMAIRAKCTATMGGLKRGLLLGRGREHSGTVHCIDIGMPRYGFAERSATTFRMEGSDAAQWLPRRAFDAHKYQVGSVFVLGGSPGMTGAAALAAEATLRSGAGIVHLGVPAGLNAVLESKLTEVMTLPLHETYEGTVSPDNLDCILQQLSRADAGLIGPGLSRHEKSMELVRAIVQAAAVPLTLDADALFALAGHISLLADRAFPTILTPHCGEFARLTGISREAVERDRIEAARSFAMEAGVTVALKGAPTVVATADGFVYLNSSGNAGMATAGSGDVLGGMIAGFLAQGCTPERAACLGVQLHGMAGDLAKRQFGERSLLASDISTALANVLRDMSQEDE
jgi:ADP-dependent NAD(P)H-hydrate dehydratase / NAD(P)H-hydrate epimerase